MAGLSISKAWDETKAVLSKDGKLLISVILALTVLPAVIIGLIAPPFSEAEPPGWVRFVSLAAALIGIAGQLAIIRLALGPAIFVRDAVAHGFRRLLSTFVALFLLGFGLALVILPVFLIFAGGEAIEAAAQGRMTPEAGRAALIVVIIVLALSARFQLLTAVGSAETVGPIKILTRSWALSKGNYWRLLAFILLTMLLAVILLIVLGQMIGGVLVGAIAGTIEPYSLGALASALLSGAAQGAFTLVISVMLARIYTQLAGRIAEPSVPDTNP